MTATALTTWPSARNDATEDRWSKQLRRFFTDGVFAATTDTNEFTPFGDSTGMVVKGDTGCSNIQGFYAESTVIQTLNIAAADATFDRIDRLILRLDHTSPVTQYIDVLTGIASNSPVPPALTVNSTIIEIPLGRIAVGHGVSTIRAIDVIDERAWCIPQNALPAGTVLDFLGTVAPAGFLIMQGQTGLLTATYPALAAALGITASTFSLPDTRDKFSRGANGNLGTIGGLAAVTLNSSHIPANLPISDPGHVHTGSGGFQYIVGSTPTSTIFSNSGSNSDHSPAYNLSATTTTAGAATGIVVNPSGGGTPVPTIPPFLAMNKIIKAH